MHIGIGAAEIPDKFQSDKVIITTTRSLET